MLRLDTGRNEKACRGRRCGRLSENIRTATGRRSVAVPANALGRRRGRLPIEPTREEVHRFDRHIIRVLPAY
jgi:hypothetical protein